MNDVEKFIKLMMMTTSSHDAEALVALRKANAILAGMDANWEEFIKGVVRWEQPQQQKASSRPKTDTVDDEGFPKAKTKKGTYIYLQCEELDRCFSAVRRTLRAGSSFADFVDDVEDFYIDKGFLTEKQFHVIKKASDRQPMWSSV